MTLCVLTQSTLKHTTFCTFALKYFIVVPVNDIKVSMHIMNVFYRERL